jgi:hypothetical protein
MKLSVLYEQEPGVLSKPTLVATIKNEPSVNLPMTQASNPDGTAIPKHNQTGVMDPKKSPNIGGDPADEVGQGGDDFLSGDNNPRPAQTVIR